MRNAQTKGKKSIQNVPPKEEKKQYLYNKEILPKGKNNRKAN